MSSPNTERRRYLAVLILGVVAGGIVVAVATKAIPKIMSGLMSQMMSEMPQKMTAYMQAEGIDPAEMCQRMMANFSRLQANEPGTEQLQS